MSEELDLRNEISISVDNEMDLIRLTELLEPLYLKGGVYNLIFTSEQMLQVQNVFDRIISRHGILGAEFHFISRETLGAHDDKSPSLIKRTNRG